MTNCVVDVREMTKTYQMGLVEVNALRGLSTKIFEGEIVAIMGPSGSGKSTLMNMLGCLDRPTSGEYFLDGKDVSKLSNDDLATIRNEKVGFVFQKFNLLSRSSALSNVELPLIYRLGENRITNKVELAKEALEAVGLGDRIHHKPNEMSGGQQQRVAIARALVTKPSIILADEPTGNLDTKSGDEIMDILKTLNKEQNVTLIIVTHDPEVAKLTDRIITIRDGRIED